MYYFKATLLRHTPERQEIEFVGPGPIQNETIAHREGNGAIEDDVVAWSPHPFIAVVSEQDWTEEYSVKAYAAEPLPHTTREVEVHESEGAATT